MKFEHITNSQISWWIGEYCHSERDRSILLRKWVDGIHFEPLAEEVDLSVRQTKEIVKREKNRLLEYFKGVE